MTSATCFVSDRISSLSVWSLCDHCVVIVSSSSGVHIAGWRLLSLANMFLTRTVNHSRVQNMNAKPQIRHKPDETSFFKEDDTGATLLALS